MTTPRTVQEAREGMNRLPAMLLLHAKGCDCAFDVVEPNSVRYGLRCMEANATLLAAYAAILILAVQRETKAALIQELRKEATDIQESAKDGSLSFADRDARQNTANTYDDAADFLESQEGL